MPNMGDMGEKGMSERRFYVPPEELADLASSPSGNSLIPIRGSEHHHLSHVLRLKKGDEVSLFDGDGRGYRGVIESISREESLVRPTSLDDRTVEPVFRLTLAQSVPHHDKMDLIVQKTTELGVG